MQHADWYDQRIPVVVTGPREKEKHMSETTEVFIVTSGSYSDYEIDSVWLTEAEARRDCEGRGSDASVEVWPIGRNKRSRGDFTRAASIDPETGQVIESDDRESPHLGEPTSDRQRVTIWLWDETWAPYTSCDEHLHITVGSDSRERCDKVFTETLARVRADISTGLPKTVIADHVRNREHRMVPIASLSGS